MRNDFQRMWGAEVETLRRLCRLPWAMGHLPFHVVLRYDRAHGKLEPCARRSNPMSDKPLTPQQQTGIGRPPTLTWDVFQAICARVRETGVKYASCAEFGLSGNHVTEQIKRYAEKGDSRWKDLWDESLELFADRLEAEMARRAIEGVDKPVFYKGEEVGTIREYSDQLAITLAKAVRPERFRENVKVDGNITGGVLLVPPKMTVEEFLAQQQQSTPPEGEGD